MKERFCIGFIELNVGEILKACLNLLLSFHQIVLTKLMEQ